MARTNELKLERKIVKQKGKEYSNYFVECELWGRKGEARIIPKDTSGYTLLDVMFGRSDEKGIPVSMIRKVTRNTNGNGQSTLITSYTAAFTDPETNYTVEVDVKPFRPSDADWIKNYIATMAVPEEDEEEVTEENGEVHPKGGIDVVED